MIILPQNVTEQRLHDHVSRFVEFLEASIDAECRWKIEVPVTDMLMSRLQAAVNQVIESVEVARKERDQLAERLVLIATVERYAGAKREAQDEARIDYPAPRTVRLKVANE